MYRVICKIMSFLGWTPLKERTRLIRELLLLEQENENLIKEMLTIQDENGSLWDMLDEIKKSDIAEHAKNQAALQAFVDEIQDAVADDMIKDFKPVGEA